MASQVLLKAIVHVVRNTWTWDHFLVHTSIVNVVSMAALLWLASIHLPYHLRPVTNAVPLRAGQF